MEYNKGIPSILYAGKQQIQYCSDFIKAEIRGDIIRNYKITALCLCAIIGAGFATGKELITYFASFGVTGFVTMFIASALFAIIINRVMNLPQSSIEELLGKSIISRIIFITLQLFLIVLYGAMLSAGGEVIKSIFRIHEIWGVIITSIISVIIIRGGCEGITDLSQVLFIPMAVIIFAICITTTEKSISIPSPTLITPKAIISPFVYVSYNMLTTIPLLITIPDKYMYRNCGNQAGIVIFLLSAMLMLPLYTHYTAIAQSPLPIMEMLTGTIKYLYEFMLMLAILTTAVSAGYSLVSSSRLMPYKKSVYIYTLGAIAISELGFANIVNKVYFVFGICGFALLIRVMRAKK